MNIRTHLAAPLKLLALFVLLAGIPLAALGWLGWQLLEQDHALENQRERERLESAASMLAHELERRLSAWDDLLLETARGSASLPANSVLLVFDSSGVLQQQGTLLPFYPQVAPLPDASAALFSDAEALEFRENALTKAAASYCKLALSGDPRLRGAALMRLARCLRKQQQWQEAVKVYGELAAMGGTPVAGSPAELLARRERIALFPLMGEKEAASREAASLASALAEGKYRIDRATFDFYAASLKLKKTSASTLADAIENFWPSWQHQPLGKISWTGEGASFVAVWRPMSARTAAIVANVNTVTAPVVPMLRNLHVRLALEDSSRRSAWGTLPNGSAPVTKTFRETGLPWTLHVAASDPSVSSAVSTSRRRLMFAGFGLMLLVIATAGYFVLRAVNRELSVARLQSDFVSAVSHEFRTPLTAMCHLTEMLEGGETPKERLPLYYSTLGKETRRLHRMVESLLDFGRMESGRREYRMEDANAAEVVREVFDEFCGQSSIGAHRLELRGAPGALPICADREALALALRNLLDNAVKYSPEGSTVSVSVESRNGLIGISVQDQGEGIPKDEQREVFRKFNRGSSARKLNVKGTGIGLTMADEIVKAHGGRLELSSEPACGSRFTILLPVRTDQPCKEF
ncbi:MAG: HAMP domain-containing histidine kinase [Acidobacteriota bacterium]|nr:HAMP domain-containing histidine kinase [Acidobacteriota bacterium]